MKHRTLCLHKICISLLLGTLYFLNPVESSAQWQQTGGPVGGSFQTMAATQSGILAVIGSEGIFRYQGGTWIKISSFTPFQIIPAGEKLIAVAHGQTYPMEYFVSDDMGGTWRPIDLHSDLTIAVSVVGETVYAIRNDTLMMLNEDFTSFKPLTPLPASSTPPIGRSNFLIRAGEAYNDTIYFSIDSGYTWKPLQSNIPPSALAIRTLVGGEEIFYTIGVDFHVFFSVGGESWQMLSDVGVGLPTERLIEWIVANDQVAFVKLQTGTIYQLRDAIWKPVPVPGYSNKGALEGNHLLIPTSTGAFSLSSDGVSLFSLADELRNIRITAMGQAGNALFAATVNAIYRSMDNGETWELVSDFSASSFESYGNTIFAIAKGEIMRSSDFGNTWVSMQTQFDQIKIARWGTTEKSLPFSGITIAPDGTQYVTSATTIDLSWSDGGVFRSIDNGKTWQDVSGGLPNNGTSYVPVTDAIALDGDVVVVSTLAGIYRSANRGLGWSKTSGGLPTDDIQKAVGRFFLLNGDVYLRTPDSLYRSNGSVSSIWRPVRDLPLNGQYWSVAGDKANIIGGKLYVTFNTWNGAATTYSTYTFDGLKWEDISSTIPAGVVFQSFIPKNNLAFAGSLGHSVWVKLLGPLSVAEPAAPARNVRMRPNPFTGELILSVELEQAIENGRIVLTNVLGEEVGTVYQGRVESGAQNFRFNASALPSGAYFLRITGGDNVIAASVIKE